MMNENGGYFQPFICHTCKMQITSETMHGWVYTGYDPIRMKTQLSPCPTCSDAAMARRNNLRIDRLLGASHIPLRMSAWSFTTVPADVDVDAKEWAVAFSNRKTEKQGLYLYGPPRGGKTGLAISIIQAAMRRGEDAVFIRSLDLLDRLRESIMRGTHDGDELLALVMHVQWLALDDLATEKPTDYVIQELKAILEHRMDCGYWTVITSNFSLHQLEAYWRPKEVDPGEFHPGLRIVARLGEYAQGVPVKGRNLRQVIPIRGGEKAAR